MGNKLMHRIMTGTHSLNTQTDEDKRVVCHKMYQKYRLAFRGVKEITAVELKERLEMAESNEHSEAPILVDCRDDHERAVSTIKGSLSQAEFENRVREGIVKETDMIVCYCTIGYRSGVYVKQMSKKHNLQNMYNLAGSLLLWVHAGGKLVGRADQGSEQQNSSAVEGIETGETLTSPDAILDQTDEEEFVRTLHVYGETWDLAPSSYQTVY